MPLLARYARATGEIRGVWDSTSPDTLVANVVEDDPAYGYVFVADGTPADELQSRYYVLHDRVTPKPVRTLVAWPNPFPADGVTVCQITVSPFVACTVLLQGTPYVLTETDHTLDLTSTTPGVWQVTIAPLAGTWAEAITVEATAHA